MLSSLTVVAFAVSAAAVWRLTHLLVYEAGPADLLDRLRALPGLAPVLGCFYCCSLWTALALAPWLGDGWVEVGVLCLGLSGAAIVIERLTAPATPPAALWHEADAAAPGVAASAAAVPAAGRPRPPDDEEDPHVLLRP